MKVMQQEKQAARDQKPQLKGGKSCPGAVKSDQAIENQETVTPYISPDKDLCNVC